jgi:hypothetical protein
LPEQDTAIASLYLSTKLNESPIRLKSILGTYLITLHRTSHIRRRCLSAPETRIADIIAAAETDPQIKVPPSHAGVWWSIKEAVCVAEMQILKRLGFNMQVRLLLAGTRFFWRS